MCILCDFVMDYIVGKSTEDHKICHECRQNCDKSFIEFKYCFYHYGCFKCNVCNIGLNKNGPSFKRLNKLYCLKDYEATFLRRCHKCNLYIKGDEQVVNLNQFYHTECFTCSKCDKLIKLNIAAEEGEEILCLDCYIPKPPESFGRCSDCYAFVEKEPFEEIDQHVWHPECFRCFACEKSLKNNSYHFFDNHIYCQEHYEILLIRRCKFCQETIPSGEAVHITDDTLIHKSCAICVKCKNLIEDKNNLCKIGRNIWHYKCPIMEESFKYEDVNMNVTPKTATLNSTYRTPTSGFTLRRQPSGFSDDFLRNHNISYLNNSTYLRRPISPKLPSVRHFNTIVRKEDDDVPRIFHSTPTPPRPDFSLAQKYNIDFAIDNNYEDINDNIQLLSNNSPPPSPVDLARNEWVLRHRRNSILEFSRLRDEQPYDFIDLTLKRSQSKKIPEVKKKPHMTKFKKLWNSLLKKTKTSLY